MRLDLRAREMTRTWIFVGTASALVAVALTFGMVKPRAQPTISLPFVTVAAVTNTASQIIGANPSRKTIQICTAGSTTTFTIAPAPITPVAATNGFMLLGTATTSVCFTPPGSVGGTGQGGAGAAWNAIGSVAGPTNLLILEW